MWSRCRETKNIVAEGVKEAQLEEEALLSCLSTPGTSPQAKTMVLALVTSSLAHVASTWPQTHVVIIPDNVSEKDFGKFYDVFHHTEPTLAFSCFDMEDDQEHGDIPG